MPRPCCCRSRLRSSCSPQDPRTRPRRRTPHNTAPLLLPQCSCSHPRATPSPCNPCYTRSSCTPRRSSCSCARPRIFPPRHPPGRTRPHPDIPAVCSDFACPPDFAGPRNPRRRSSWKGGGRRRGRRSWAGMRSSWCRRRKILLRIRSRTILIPWCCTRRSRSSCSPRRPRIRPRRRTAIGMTPQGVPRRNTRARCGMLSCTRRRCRGSRPRTPCPRSTARPHTPYRTADRRSDPGRAGTSSCTTRCC
mmetsp:Transcript_60697/g.144387  ORF Transcript_60697/g.144387 Transcript_60697/m.144387 type:complete len:248 (-) Transcript_60697:2028-2771(-)